VAPVKPSWQINASGAVIQAALAGRGVALARLALVADALADGSLVEALPGARWPIAWAYFMVHTEAAVAREPAAKFMAWLVRQTTETQAQNQPPFSGA
jgi:LysR family transcriptional regulator, glycine cleavage system transcriptional activator